MTGCAWTFACERRAAGVALSPADLSFDSSVAVCVVHALDAREHSWEVRRLRGAPIRGLWLIEWLICECVDPVDDLDGCCGGCTRELITEEVVAAVRDAGYSSAADTFDLVRRRQSLELAAAR